MVFVVFLLEFGAVPTVWYLLFLNLLLEHVFSSTWRNYIECMLIAFLPLKYNYMSS